MRRGDIHLVDLDPARRGEASKQRPAVVVSNDAANATTVLLRRGVVTVVPATSNTSKIYPFQVLLEASQGGLDQNTKAQAEQVRSVSIERIGAALGRVSVSNLKAIDNALRLHLDL